MKTLELNQMEILEGGREDMPPWSCIGGTIGLIGLGIGITASTGGIGTLAWGGMMVSAFGIGGSLGHCVHELNDPAKD